jgi:hypothetical protein
MKGLLRCQTIISGGNKSTCSHHLCLCEWSGGVQHVTLENKGDAAQKRFRPHAPSASAIIIAKIEQSKSQGVIGINKINEGPPSWRGRWH